jgi:hypothetical protein
MNDTCLICLDNITDQYIIPPCKTCKIKIHINCYNELFNTGLICPICRLEYKKYSNTSRNRQYDIVEKFINDFGENLIKLITNSNINYFMIYLLIYLLISFIISVFIIIPYCLIRFGGETLYNLFTWFADEIGRDYDRILR